MQSPSRDSLVSRHQLFRVTSEVAIKKERESDEEKGETVKRVLLKEEMRESSKNK